LAGSDRRRRLVFRPTGVVTSGYSRVAVADIRIWRPVLCVLRVSSRLSLLSAELITENTDFIL